MFASIISLAKIEKRLMKIAGFRKSSNSWNLLWKHWIFLKKPLWKVKFSSIISSRGIARILFRGWNILKGRFRGGWYWGGAPRTPKKVRKFAKVFFKTLLKCIIFAYFTHSFTNPALIFRASGRITNSSWRYFENILKILD